MSERDKANGFSASIPAWKRAESPGGPLEQARKFLQDDQVIASSRDKKVDFLKSKGLEEADIDALLDEADGNAAEAERTADPTSELTTSMSVADTKAHQPLIITYPEFLTKPTVPPPLITTAGLLNTLSLVAGLSAFVYGATRYLISPMVETLTEARIDLHSKADEDLAQLVEKLEHVVSEIPASYHSAGRQTPALTLDPRTADDKDGAEGDSPSTSSTSSSYDDPTELFHRDVGVQTSPPPTPRRSSSPHHLPTTAAASKHSSALTTQQQADKLARLTSSLRDLSGSLISEAEGLAETKNVLDQFGADLHGLNYPPESFGAGSNYLYGTSLAEPDDEIKKLKNNIRSVKGVLLSTKSFAAPTR